MKILKRLLIPFCVVFIAWSWSKVEGIRLDAYHTMFYSGFIELWAPDDSDLHEVNVHITATFENGGTKEFDVYRAHWGTREVDKLPDPIWIRIDRDKNLGVIQRVEVKGKCKEGRIKMECVSSGFTL